MDIYKKLNEIEDHFRNIKDEELTQNLIRAGLGKIEPSNNSEMKMITEEELILEKSNYTYNRNRRVYRFDNLPLQTSYPKVEVA